MLIQLRHMVNISNEINVFIFLLSLVSSCNTNIVTSHDYITHTITGLENTNIISCNKILKLKKKKCLLFPEQQKQPGLMTPTICCHSTLNWTIFHSLLDPGQVCLPCNVSVWQLHFRSGNSSHSPKTYFRCVCTYKTDPEVQCIGIQGKRSKLPQSPWNIRNETLYNFLYTIRRYSACLRLSIMSWMKRSCPCVHWIPSEFSTLPS